MPLGLYCSDCNGFRKDQCFVEGARPGKDHRLSRHHVILQYIQGQPKLRLPFSPDVLKQARFAVSPVVLQELLLAGSSEDKLEALTPHLEIIGPDLSTESSILARIRNVRNRSVHTNDVLILETAQRCDVLLTNDQELLRLGNDADIAAMTPEAFLDQLRDV
jgi:predicted nucleic acid-binding protein